MYVKQYVYGEVFAYVYVNGHVYDYMCICVYVSMRVPIRKRSYMHTCKKNK